MGLVLFGMGVWSAYTVVLPMTLKFTMGFQTAALEQAITIGPYLDVVTRVLLAFGLVFELPVVILILSALGLVTPEFLAAKRKHAILIITVVASLLTPGDVITLTVMMMVPLMLLYEFSMVTRRRIAATAASA
jgi:sec-independent protein translocase protein TatC